MKIQEITRDRWLATRHTVNSRVGRKESELEEWYGVLFAQLVLDLVSGRGQEGASATWCRTCLRTVWGCQEALSHTWWRGTIEEFLEDVRREGKDGRATDG